MKINRRGFISSLAALVLIKPKPKKLFDWVPDSCQEELYDYVQDMRIPLTYRAYITNLMVPDGY